MPTYEVEVNGQTFEIEAPDDQSVKLAVRQLQSQQPPAAQPTAASSQLDEYYSKGIYGGSMNPLGPIARSVDAFASSAQKAPLFGWGDEVAAAPSLLTGNYDENRQSMNDRSAALRESNPVASISGEIAGSGLGAGAISRLGVLPSASLAPAASLGTRMAVGAGEGFGLGALTGAGNGDGDARIPDALWGGVTGAALGGAIPAVVQGASSAYRNVVDALARNRVARDAGVDPSVAAQLARTLDADGTLGPQGAANMARAGNEAMLADAGPNARTVLDTAIQRGGPGATLARGRIDERVGRDSAALTGALDNSLGTPEGVYASQNSIRSSAKPAVNDAYKAANQAPIDYASDKGRVVEDIINRIPNRIKRGAIERANERIVYDGMDNMQIMASIADDGKVTLKEMPNVMQADAIKKALDDIVRDGTDEAGKLSADASFASRMARDLRDAVADAVPEYGAALKTAADPLSRQSAVSLGSKLLRPGMTRDQLAIATDGFTDPQKDALAQGVRSHIDDVMANVTRTVQDGNTDAREAYKAIRDLSSRANREKLTIALGESRAKPLFDELDRVAQSFELKGSVAENSKTFARQATNRMVEGMAGPGVVGKAAQGEPIKATKRIVQLLTGQTPERVASREDAIYSQIADYLTRPSQQALPAFQAMQNFQGQTMQNQARAQVLARLLGQSRNLIAPATSEMRARSQ